MKNEFDTKEGKADSFKKPFVAVGTSNAIGYAGFKLWKAYQNGDINMNFLHKENVPEPIAVSEEQEIFHVGNGTQRLGFAQATTIHGQSALDVPFDPEVYQFYSDTCAIQSQHLILKDFGIKVTQNELIDIAKMNGWYAEGYGTPAEFVGKLLEYYGIDVHATEGNNIFNLANELSQGHQVIVAVDSGELVHPEEEIWEDDIMGERADHALVVVGLDTTTPDDIKVIVTDPGTGNKQWAYSEKEFMDAWHDSNCTMISTEQSPGEFQGSEIHRFDDFADISTDDLSQLADMHISANYDFFEEFYNSIMENPESWETVVDEYPNLFFTDDYGVVHFIEPDGSGEEIPLFEV